MSSLQETTPVDVITRHHRYSGLVINQGYRVADVLSDSRTDILEMRDTVVTVGGARPSEMSFRRILLRKDQVLMAILKGEHEAPLRRRNKYVEKERFGAIVVLPGYVLSGILHLPPQAVPSMLLIENTTLPSFIGMTSVTVHGSVFDFVPSQCDVAIIRRPYIESIDLAAKPLPKQSTSLGAISAAGPPEPHPAGSA